MSQVKITLCTSDIERITTALDYFAGERIYFNGEEKRLYLVLSSRLKEAIKTAKKE